ncbi:MAG: hypothetical protein GAK28_00529 [Luteibacter sp.]|uniref:hypothetical protein n=1 Tax=Luteibacter sp. TaxID=1886636 RepID=UPI0013831B23|nr:hypothetical protein [Luteibacter sp.]KAF1008897.1 MAG: hypothetical protein GAK28_00529 [Luteibacter sp.]
MRSSIRLLILTIASMLTPASHAMSGGSAATTYAVDLHVDVASGRVDGNACVSNRPAGFTDAFVLNVGLNVARVTDGDHQPLRYDGWGEPTIDGEARVYTVTDAPPTFCVQYSGAFPVYPAHDAPGDFKGLMAFNGDSFRFSEQSAWLPLPYDTKAKVRESEGSYDLEIRCDSCRFLYANGSPAIVGTKGTFHSDIARPMLVFGGTGPITTTANAMILNETVAPVEANAISDLMGKVRTYYQGYMGKPMADRPTFLRMVTIDQVERDRKGGEWGFATWPTIALSGSVAKSGAILLAGGPAAHSRIAYLAHEMGHYYFGTLVHPQGPYRWFLLESTAEFLSMKALRAIVGDEAADKRVAAWKAQMDKRTVPFIALDAITSEADITETYRYSYGPLLLLSLEKAAGEKKMRAFLRELLATPRIMTWSDLRDTAAKAGIDANTWKRWTEACVANGRRACQA